MTQEFVVVIGMLVLYLCSFLGLITAWVYYRKYKTHTGDNKEKTQKTGA